MLNGKYTGPTALMHVSNLSLLTVRSTVL